MSKLPSRQDILDFIAEQEGKVAKRDIARAFGIKGQHRIGLKKLLREMAAEGLLDGTPRKELYASGTLPKVGVVQVTHKDADGELHGRAILRGTLLEKPDIIISGRHKPPAIGDRLLVRLKEFTHDIYAASVIRHIGAAQTQPLIGVLRQDGRGTWVQPADRRERYDYQISGALGGAQKDDLVICEKISTPGHSTRQVQIKEVICAASDAGAFSLIALAEQNIPLTFSAETLAEAERCQPIGLENRTDLRALPLITIDPSDARDHDDAVFAEADSDSANQGGWHIYIAIADVAAYIPPASAMDSQARQRGNSVYLPDRVVPMLPERISNDLCSLRPNEDRPALVVKITIDKNGQRKAHQFFRAMICSKARLNYRQAQAAFDGTPDEICQPIYETVLRPLWQAYTAMVKARDKRQPLTLDLPERKIVMNDEGEIIDIFIPEQLESMRLIEEMMVSANICAALTLEKHKTPLIYRIHDTPMTEKIHALADFIRPLGVAIDLGQPIIARFFNHILAGAKKTAYSDMVQEAILRTQAQAVYSPDNIGHFGLALGSYAHFTSPIRRYADLTVHRALIHALEFGVGGGVENEPHVIAEHISLTERRAMLAERSAKDRYLAAYMAERVGEIFAGQISGISSGGLFVRLDETGADGFIPISRLGAERFEKNEDAMMLTGLSTGLTFKIGEAVRARLVEATPLKGGLLLSLIEGGEREQKPAKSHPRPVKGRRKKSPSRAGRRRAKAKATPKPR